MDYTHLVNIIYKVFGAEAAKATTQEMQTALNAPITTTPMMKEYLSELERAKKIQEGTADSTKKNTAAMGDFEKALKRALIVAPVWMAARAAMQAVLVPIKELIKAFMELDAGLAKVMTVTRISTSEQSKFYGELAQAAWKYYKTSAASMKDITEAMYQIGTAGRSTTEIMNGFNHVLDISIATFGNVKDAGRVVTGILNVFGDSLEGLVTSEEKMRYISDLLVYTWSKHQVELNEISTAIGYVGAAADSLDIDLKTLVGTIGFLNDGLLRGSKAGTSLLNTFIQLAKSPEKLKNLGVAFDPSKPLDLVDIMQQLHRRFEQTGKSLDFTSDLFDAFGNRGGRAVALIVQNFDKWIDAIKQSDSEFQNFAERTKKTAEETLPKAFEKFLKMNLIPTFPAGEKNPITEYLNKQNLAMEEAAENFKLYKKLIEMGIKFPSPPTTQWFNQMGQTFQTFPKDLAERIAPLKELWQLQGIDEIMKNIAAESSSAAEQFGTVAERANQFINYAQEGGWSWAKFNKELGATVAPLLNITQQELLENEILKKSYEYRLAHRQEVEKQSAVQSGLTATLKAELTAEYQSTQYALMKIAGAKEEEISYMKIKNIIDEINNRTNEANIARKAVGKELYQQISLEDALAGNWDKILRSGSLLLDKEKDISAIEKERRNIQISLAENMKKQLDMATQLYMQYEKADMFEKNRLGRLLELQQMSPEELKSAMEENVYDKGIIEEYFSYFSESGQAAVQEIVNDWYEKMTGISLKIEPGTMISPAEMAGLAPGGTATGEVPVQLQQQNTINIDSIKLELPTGTFEMTIDKFADEFAKKLREDENFRKGIAQVLGEEI